MHNIINKGTNEMPEYMKTVLFPNTLMVTEETRTLTRKMM